MKKKKDFFWKKINRRVKILSIKPFRVSFFAGKPKNNGEEQAVAIEVAKKFNRPDNLIWIGFNKKRRKWVIIVEADDINNTVRKIKKIFTKEIFPAMIRGFNELLQQRTNEQRNSHLPVISNTLPIFGG